MSQKVDSLTGPWRTLTFVLGALVVALGIFLRFDAHSALWLDEALTVNRSGLPLSGIAGSLKQDGSPPLYYYLLHFWMGLFGQSDLAVRSLAGVISVATLPVAWLAGNKFGGRVVGYVTLLLLASAPFAVYYATEARPYSLAMLLSGCGYLALRRVLIKPRPGNLVASGLVAAGLLYTEYWALYLVATVGAWLLGRALYLRAKERREGGDSGEWKRSAYALCAVAAGCLLFVPWLPIFVYQAHHTGTPWAMAPNFASILGVVTGFTENQGSLSTLGTPQGRLLALIYLALFALALFGSAKSGDVIELDLYTRPRARAMTIAILGTLFVAVVCGILLASAFVPRYAAVIFLPLLLVVALGSMTFLDIRVRWAVLAVAIAAGMVTSVQNIDTQRTQATKVTSVINAHAKAGDVIAFCPDQLGPSVVRLTDDPSRYTMLTFPRGTAPQFVNWVNYKGTVGAANPVDFDDKLTNDAGSMHTIWLVWEPGYQTFSTKCEAMVNTLLENNHYTSKTWVDSNGYRYYEPMYLTEYTPVTP